MRTGLGSADLPEWAVAVVPLSGPAPRSSESEDGHELDGFAARIANDGRRVATFLIDPSYRKKDLDAALAFGVHLILRREGRLDLHAAAVTPAPGEGGLLIVGPKGSGKSSLTIALALSGWTFFSDDHILAWKEGREVRVTGLRVPLFLTSDTADRLPSHLPRGREVPAMGKRMFLPDELFPGQHLSDGSLAGVIFPERTSAGPSRLLPLRPMDCFQRLLSLFPFLAADPSAKPCIEVARAIADLPSFVLRAGPDVLDPRAADRLLRSSLS